MAEFVIVTEDPEWVRYQWRVEADNADDAVAALYDGRVLDVTAVGDNEDVDGLDRVVVSVEPAPVDALPAVPAPDGWSKGTP